MKLKLVRELKSWSVRTLNIKSRLSKIRLLFIGRILRERTYIKNL
jgi:hypothetical protein